jgi:hypothetical protein
VGKRVPLEVQVITLPTPIPWALLAEKVIQATLVRQRALRLELGERAEQAALEDHWLSLLPKLLLELVQE